jgi:hypothetical protein
MLKKRFFIISLVLITMLILVGSVSAVEWKAVNYASPEAVAESGLTVEEFNNLSKADWEKLFNKKKKVNFAFSLQDGEGKDITNSSNPNVSINVNGLSDSQIVQFKNIELDSNIDSALVGEIYTFTNAGQTGRYGPSQTRIDNAYLGTNLEGKVISNNGIQEWIVPADGKYRITAYGAASGNAKNSSQIGKGALIEGDIEFSSGEKIFILVGQKSLSNTNGNVGGGGGTFVAKGTQYSSSDPLIVAGGGGGVETTTTNYSEKNGWINENGQKGGGVNSYANSHGINGYGSRYNSSGNAGGGGGGFYGNGTSSYRFDSTGNFNGGEGGKAFINGGNGGRAYLNNALGGFGGGAGAYGSGGGAGGGGGYSGGANGKNSNNHTAGGGGSYNSGKNQNNTSGINSGHGSVIIEYIGK